MVVRRRSGIAQPLEVRVAIIGNVDSGKSTLVGVMTRRCACRRYAATCKGRTCGVAAACQLACLDRCCSVLDDGRGLARSKVFKHSHEGATGRTSSIGQHNLCVSTASCYTLSNP